MSQKYYFPAKIDLVKSSDGTVEEDKHRAKVRIVASENTVDKVNDIIITKAFEAARKSYINEGYIDWDHVSLRGKTPEEKAKAHIGEPIDLVIEKNDNGSLSPVLTGYLFKSNPYVRDAILPALLAKSHIYGASVGGNIIKKSDEWDVAHKSKVRKISEISLQHIAITPLFKSIHPRTSVALIKALEEEDGIVEFTSINELGKALMAGSGTDIATLSGGQALQGQSLEGAGTDDIWKRLLQAISTKSLEPTFDGITRWLTSKGLSLEKAKAVAIVAAQNVDRLRHALPIITRGGRYG